LDREEATPSTAGRTLLLLLLLLLLLGGFASKAEPAAVTAPSLEGGTRVETTATAIKET